MNVLAHYMSDLHTQPLLNAQQEVALAREIEAGEIAHWRALLSYSPALSVIEGALKAHLLEGAPKLTSASGRGGSAERPSRERPSEGCKDAAKIASKLRALDTARVALSAADAAVCTELEDDPRARPYLARVGEARRAQQAMKGRFVAANLRLVISMARRYQRALLPLSDLIQEGNLGLMHAVERFDYRRGFRFSTYAAWWIRHSFNRALSDKARVVRIPVHALDDLARIASASRKATLQTGVAASNADIARELNMTEEKVATLRNEGVSAQPMSLDRTVGDDQSLHELIAGPEQPDPIEALDLERSSAQLRKLLTRLPSIEAAILRYRFGLDGGDELTLREIGEKYNLSRERIRQLQQEALGKLRDAMRDSEQHGSAASIAA